MRCSFGRRVISPRDAPVPLSARRAGDVRRMSTVPRHIPRAGPLDVFVLDFDGVLVDSEPEVTQSAFLAAPERWPHLKETLKAKEPELRGLMRRCRPALVKGFESMVMMRVLAEDPTKVDEILKNWEKMMPHVLKSWGEDAAELAAAFEKLRAEWMNERTESWMSIQHPYPGMVQALNESPYPVYIATSKQGNRVSALFKHLFGQGRRMSSGWSDIPEDSPRLFSSLLPPDIAKAEKLADIASRPICNYAMLHFVDDRLETLEAIMKDKRLTNWKLYLADYGYCSEEEKRRASTMGRVRRVSAAQVKELLLFGLIMGVDDGCEPTSEEVTAGVFVPRSNDE